MTAFDVFEAEFHKVMPNSDVKSFFKKPMPVNKLVKRVKEDLGGVRVEVAAETHAK